MAGAGFLFTPHETGDDTAKCFYCGIELSGWDPNDDPVYVSFGSSIAPGLTLLERNTGGELRNVARGVPSSLQRSQSSLRRRLFAEPRPKRPYKLRRPLELVLPKPLTPNQTLVTKRKMLGGVPDLGRRRQRRPLLGVLPPLDPELRHLSRRQTNLVEVM